MKCLITGSHGFVGRRFVKRFADSGDEVTCIDNMISGVPTEDWMHKPEKTDKLRIHHADCRQLFAAFKANYFDLVVHCAAVVGGRLKIENDTLAVATDLSIDAEMFNWVVRAQKPPKVIYFSSSAAYPLSFQTRNYHERLAEGMVTFGKESVLLPDMTYGWAKISGEYLAKFAQQNYGLDVHIYRPFGGYGEDQSYDYPFPSIVRRVLRGDDPVVVWGSGEQCRDFIYIDDVVECVMKTMHEPPGTVLNIGTGVATSFIDLAKKACEVIGVKRRVVPDPKNPEGVFYRVADIARMGRYYKPTTGLMAGIAIVAHHIEKTVKVKVNG